MEINEVNRIIKWGNEVNLDVVKCEMCGKKLDINEAVLYEDEGYYCQSCNKRVYRGENDVQQDIKELREIITKKDNMIIELTNTIEELENELNAYKTNEAKNECTLGYIEEYTEDYRDICGDVTD